MTRPDEGPDHASTGPAPLQTGGPAQPPTTDDTPSTAPRRDLPKQAPTTSVAGGRAVAARRSRRWFRRRGGVGSAPEQPRTARLGELFGDLTGRGDRLLVDLLLDQLAAAAEGVALASALARGELPPGSARSRMGEVEHEGDTRRGLLVARLRRSVSSPIDREDLFRLSRSVDDVLDTVRDFIREADLFGAGGQDAYQPVLDALARGIAELGEAVRLLPEAPQRAAEHALHAKKQGLRTHYQYAVAALLAGPLTAETLKATLLLHRLDTAGIHLATAADALADGVVKRFH